MTMMEKGKFFAFLTFKFPLHLNLTMGLCCHSIHLDLDALDLTITMRLKLKAAAVCLLQESQYVFSKAKEC